MQRPTAQTTSTKTSEVVQFHSSESTTSVTQVTEIVEYTEVIEYTEVDGVEQVTGRDLQVSDHVEVTRETSHLDRYGQRVRDGVEVTEFDVPYEIQKDPFGRVLEVDQTREMTQSQSAQIQTLGSTRSFSELKQIEEVEVDFDLETRADATAALVYGQGGSRTIINNNNPYQQNTVTTTQAARITDVQETDSLMDADTTFFYSDAKVKRRSSQITVSRRTSQRTAERRRPSDATEIIEITEVIEIELDQTQADAQQQEEGGQYATITEVGEIREAVELDSKDEHEADQMLVYAYRSPAPQVAAVASIQETKRDSKQINEEFEQEARRSLYYDEWESAQISTQSRARAFSDTTNVKSSIEEANVSWRKRPAFTHQSTSGSVTTLMMSNDGASTEGFFKTPHTYPPVPPLPVGLRDTEKRTIVNVDLSGREGCIGLCREIQVDQAKRLMEVTGSKEANFKPFFRILLLAVFVILCTLGIAGALLAFIWAGKLEANRWRIVTLAPQGTVLLITTFASKVVLICIPFLLAIMAYYIAAAWMLRNASVTQVDRRGCGCVITRTPDGQTTNIVNEEYGLLLGMLKGATVFTLWATVRHYLFKASSSERKKVSKPLIQAFSVLFVAVVILYSIIGLDLALHHASTTDYIPFRGPVIPAALLSSDSKLYSRSIRSECLNPNANGTACTVKTQNLLGGLTSVNTTTSFQAGLQTLAGLSSTTAVTSVDFKRGNGSIGQIAILVDKTHPLDDAFTARTIGVHAQCDLVSPHCDMVTHCDDNHSPPSTHPNITARHPTCTGFSCSMPDWPIYWDGGMTNGTSFFVSEPLEIRNDSALYSLQAPPSYLATDVNSFRFFAALGSYVDPTILATECTQKSSDTGACVKGRDDGYVYSSQAPIEPTPFYRKLVTGCTISVFDVEYEHIKGKYTVNQDTAKLADNSTTLALSSVLYTTDARTTAIGASLAALASGNSTSGFVAGAMESSISQMMVGMGQAAFEATAAVSVVTTLDVPITILPTPLVVAFVAFLVAFALMTIVLALLALVTINRGLWMARRKVAASRPDCEAEKTPVNRAAGGAQEHCEAPTRNPRVSSSSLPLPDLRPPPGPERLYSEKTVVGGCDDENGRAVGYCS